jgi:hypothetical protein
MRILMAIALCAGSVLALDAFDVRAADAAPKYKRFAKKQQHTSKQRLTAQQRLECERARQEDPTGEFVGFPCWAREAFGRARRPYD